MIIDELIRAAKAYRAAYGNCGSGFQQEAANGLDDALKMMELIGKPSDPRKPHLIRFDTQTVERAIIAKLCILAIAKGYWLRLHDGEGFMCPRTQDASEILKDIGACDEQSLVLYASGERGKADRAGSFFFVFGNSGWDVVSDYADNSVCNELDALLEPLVKHFEAIDSQH